MAGIRFEEQHVGTDDPSTRAELLLLSPSFLVPRLTHDGMKVWDTLALAEYLHEINQRLCRGAWKKARAAKDSTARILSVPGRARTGLETDQAGTHPRRRRRLDNRLLPDD